MKLTFALLIIVFLAFSGYHLSFRNLKLPYFARQFYLTGTEFLFLGLLLGPQFLNLLDPETQNGLAPLKALVLGWIGLLFGFQFEFKNIRRFPLEFFTAAIIESLLTLILVFITVYLSLQCCFDVPEAHIMGIALILAAAAGCTSQTGLALLSPGQMKKHQKTIVLLRFISSMSGIGAMLFLCLAVFFTPQQMSSGAGGFSWQGVAAGAGVSLGLLLLSSLILSLRQNEGELILVVVGMTVLACGLASAVGFSPLLTNFFLGLWIVNLSREKERIYQILMPVEKPTYLLLLFFMGVCVQFDSWWILVSAFVYCLYRISGKFIAGVLISGLNPALKRFSPRLGYGLLAQGGLPLAILMDYHHSFHSDFLIRMTSVAILAIIYNEFLSPYFLARLLSKDSHGRS